MHIRWMALDGPLVSCKAVSKVLHTPCGEEKGYETAISERDTGVMEIAVSNLCM